ncbi:DUF6417 family protein [Streptomyces luteocolor]|uniref:DUF6417 family protein n=1 Tax=Streptomyces luteocolor TaxID=285500 RepID=UPI0018772014|nr:DUF6417 family protein [Streptomyces luteocolor]
MGRSTGHYALLQRMADTQGTATGWVTVGAGFDEHNTKPLVDQRLAQLATREDQAELSARAGRPVLWAVRLTDDGWDALLYIQAQPVPIPDEAAAPGLRKVALRRSEMEALRRYLALSGQLRQAPALGLQLAVEVARFDPGPNRWIVHVDDEQAQSMARAFFMERVAGSAAPANRIAREYGVTYPPRPILFTPTAERDRAETD